MEKAVEIGQRRIHTTPEASPQSTELSIWSRLMALPKSLERLAAWLAIGAILACWTGSSRGDEAVADMVRSAFLGFVYVGSFPAEHLRPPKHSYDPQELPRRYEAGRIYVFHFPGDLDDANFAVTELPKRLHAAGAKVREAPMSINDMPHVDPGDRVWRLVFVHGNLQGTIYNTLDQELFQRGGLVAGGNCNAFVLKFESLE